MVHKYEQVQLVSTYFYTQYDLEAHPVSLFWETQYHQVHILHMPHSGWCFPAPGAAQKPQTVCKLCGTVAVISAPLQHMHQRYHYWIILTSLNSIYTMNQVTGWNMNFMCVCECMHVQKFSQYLQDGAETGKL